jgi:hypothetical protein
MERLPYIDGHGVEVDADVDATWQALVRVAQGMVAGDSWFARTWHLEPAASGGKWSPDVEPGAALPGFAVAEVRKGEVLSLRGGHRFARYRLDFELDAPAPGRAHLWARTWAEFPGLKGRAYRALVIDSGGHRVVVKRMLRRIANIAQAA